MQKNVVIAGFARSPFHFAHKGALTKVRPDELAAQVVEGLILRAGIDPADVEDVIVGCAFPEGEQGMNVARLIALLAHLPISVAGATVNRFCGSSMQAIHMAAGAIQLDAGEVFVCAGVESMTRVPIGGYNPLPSPRLAAEYPQAYDSMGVTAENVARGYQITREAQQAFAVTSHRKAAAAREQGCFTAEIVPIRRNGEVVESDGCIRPDTSQEGLSGLKPAFDENGTVTAGTSSPLTDGAAAVLVCTEDYAHRHGLDVLARLKSIAVAGCAAEIMGIGPVAATRKALARAGLEIGDIEVVELNEAFASQALACVRDLAIDPETLNLDGGALALGHPLGATGARITGKTAALMRREGRRYGLATQCIGGGQGIATVLEFGLMPIRRAAVIGAGVMGSGIAAQIANAGIPVLLLDLVPPGGDRNALAAGALERMAKADPAPFMSRQAQRLVTPGNLEDDLARLGEVDWIVEAVIEKLEVKRDLYARLEAVRRPGGIVSSNTSTLPLARLTEGLTESFRRDFLITHFFNPPRYMRLLEVVAGPETRAEAVEEITAFADHRLGKSVVRGKDTPGFIANRIGSFWMQAAFCEAFDANLPVEQADLVLGRPLGIPKTGIFGLADLVGIDLLPHVAASLRAALPPDDPFHEVDREFPLITKLIATGFTGRKGKGGFYRLNRAGGQRVKEAIDLASGAYHPATRPRLEALDAAKDGGPRALFETGEPAARYAWRVMSRTLAYACSLVPEIADEITAVDEAMKRGYNWKWGPFELLDRIGPAWFAARLEAEGSAVPPLLEQARARSFYRVADGRLQHLTTAGAYADVLRPAGVLLLEDVKRRSRPVAKNGSASLWDIGDGVACLEFHSKMNAIDAETLDLIDKAIGMVASDFKALVIYNEGSEFSVGANIGLALFAANVAVWPMVEDLVARGQKVYRKLKHAPFPVVAAPSGLALGGGCEVCLNAAAVVAHAETYIGLVEVGVGVVPAWTGSTELLTRWAHNPQRPRGPMPPLAQAFETIGMAKVAKSAFEARELLFLREGDGITMNRDRLLADAKTQALAMLADHRPPEKSEIALPGPSGRIALEMAVDALRLKGAATPHDAVVASQLAIVLSGGDTDITTPLGDDDLLRLERQAFMTLIRQPATLARIEHMLETGKPLRN